MLNLRTGIDMIEIDRLESLKPPVRDRFIQRVFTPAEIALAGDHHQSAFWAGRFAAKEAVSKALGTGIGTVSWQEIEILRAPNGEPSLNLTGQAAIAATARGLTQWSVSISHSRSHAVATATAIGESQESR